MLHQYFNFSLVFDPSWAGTKEAAKHGNLDQITLGSLPRLIHIYIYVTLAKLFSPLFILLCYKMSLTTI